jgi:hypothetical protein
MNSRVTGSRLVSLVVAGVVLSAWSNVSAEETAEDSVQADPTLHVVILNLSCCAQPVSSAAAPCDRHLGASCSRGHTSVVDLYVQEATLRRLRGMAVTGASNPGL